MEAGWRMRASPSPPGGAGRRIISGGRAQVVGDEGADPLRRPRPGVKAWGGRIRDLAGLDLVGY